MIVTPADPIDCGASIGDLQQTNKLTCWGAVPDCAQLPQAVSKLSLLSADRPGCLLQALAVPCNAHAECPEFEEVDEVGDHRHRSNVVTVEECRREDHYDSRLQSVYSTKSDASKASVHDSLRSLEMGKGKGKCKDKSKADADADKLVSRPSMPDTAYEGESSSHEEEWINSTIDPYDIYFTAHSNGKLSRIGRGAFGTVYKGMYRERPVAVKVCRRANLSSMAMKQFEKEVCILQRCAHPNVVTFVGACTWKGGQRTVLVTELMEKGDLYTLLGKYQGRFAWHKLGRYVALDVARGLAFLHSRNIVHFDLKSANVLLDKKYRAKLADVGLSKTLTHSYGCDSLATYMATGELGTFAWAAPEVLLGLPCNAKADIYSMGVLLWELATSLVPQGRDLRFISVPAEGPPALASLINACLDNSPSNRPSADQLVHIIQHML